MRFKRSTCIVLTLILIFSLSVMVCASPDDAFDRKVTARVNVSRIMEDMEYLSVDIGPRVASSPEEKEVAAYIADVYRQYGYDVEIQEFPYANNAAYLTVLEDEGKNIYLQVGSRSILTEEGGITARVIDCGFGSPDEFPAEVSGNIALVKRGVNTFANMAANAENAGAVALLIHNNDWRRFTVNVNTDIPYATMNDETGEELLTVDGLVNFQVNRYETSQNVIATRKPQNKDNGNIVMVMAHYDSVPTSPGASDNGSGTVVALEVARVLSNMPIESEIRFLSVGAEEVGLRGSRYYVSTLTEEELDRTLLVYNMDMIGTAGEGQDHLLVGTVDGSDNLVSQTVRAAAERLGYGDIVVAPFMRGSSDHVSFYEVGIDSGNTTWRGADGQLEPWYHHPYDAFERVSPERMEIGAKVVAAAAYDMIRKQTPNLVRSRIRNRVEMPFDMFENIENLGPMNK